MTHLTLVGPQNENVSYQMKSEHTARMKAMIELEHLVNFSVIIHNKRMNYGLTIDDFNTNDRFWFKQEYKRNWNLIRMRGAK